MQVLVEQMKIHLHAIANLSKYATISEIVLQNKKPQYLNAFDKKRKALHGTQMNSPHNGILCI